MLGQPRVDARLVRAGGVGLGDHRGGERVLRLVEVVAERGACLGLPPVGARQRGDALAQSVETEPIVEQELDPRDRGGVEVVFAREGDRRQRHQRGVARRDTTSEVGGDARLHEADRGRLGGVGDRSHQQLGRAAVTARTPDRKRSTVGPSASDCAWRTNQRADRSTSRRTRRNISSCTAAGTARSRASTAAHVSAASSTSRAMTWPRPVRGARVGLVAQAREEADPGAVHDRVGDDRGHDLAAQRV